MRGQSVIIFTFFIPFIFVILLGLMEMGRLHITSERASTLARESAMLAYQKCAGKDRSDARSCVERMLLKINANLPNTFADLSANGTIIISAYGRSDTGNIRVFHNNITYLPRVAIQGQVPSDMMTKYQASNFNDLYGQGYRFVVVSEVYYRYHPIFDFSKLIPGMKIPDMIYESTVV